MGAREDLLGAGERLTAGGRTPFSSAELIAEARSGGSNYPDSTPRTFIVGPMCLNSPDNHAQAKRTSTPLQARAYFSHAHLDGVLLRADHESARVALAFPDKETYLTFARRSVPTLGAARIELWLVRSDGQVEIVVA